MISDLPNQLDAAGHSGCSHQQVVQPHPLVTIYCADCREVLPRLQWDVMISDPPYGINHASGWEGPYEGQVIHGDANTELREWALTINGDRPAAIFGTWRVPHPANVRAKLVWDKGPASGMGDLAFPWKPSWEEIYIIGSGWAGRRDEGVLRANMVTWASKGRSHPNQKPTDLMVQIIRKAPAGVILDPFMGSGSTGIACVTMGRQFIGVERDPIHFETALQRFKSEAAQGKLW